LCVLPAQHRRMLQSSPQHRRMLIPSLPQYHRMVLRHSPPARTLNRKYGRLHLMKTRPEDRTRRPGPSPGGMGRRSATQLVLAPSYGVGMGLRSSGEAARSGGQAGAGCARRDSSARSRRPLAPMPTPFQRAWPEGHAPAARVGCRQASKSEIQPQRKGSEDMRREKRGGVAQACARRAHER
jgi:hypothetical protein